MTKTEKRIKAINQQGHGFRIVEAGQGWKTPYLLEYKHSGLCRPITHYLIYCIARRVIGEAK